MTEGFRMTDAEFYQQAYEEKAGMVKYLMGYVADLKMEIAALNREIATLKEGE